MSSPTGFGLRVAGYLVVLLLYLGGVIDTAVYLLICTGIFVTAVYRS